MSLDHHYKTHGFAEGSMTVKSGRVKILGLKVIERIYPFECVGSFNSNDSLLNKLWKVCTRFVDCSDSERTEWMDDTPPCYDVTRTTMAGPGEKGKKMFADPRLLGELLRRTALTLQPEDGSKPIPVLTVSICMRKWKTGLVSGWRVGRYLEIEVSSGSHSGRVEFTPTTDSIDPKLN